MRIGTFEIVLIIAVILAVAFVWRWLREGRVDGDEYYGDDGEESGEGSGPPQRSRLWDIGLVLVLGGLGLLVAGYIIVVGLATVFIWATAILLLGLVFLLLSQR